MCRSSSLLTRHLGHPGRTPQIERVSAEPAGILIVFVLATVVVGGEHSIHWGGKAEDSFRVLSSSPATSRRTASESLGLLSCRFGFNVLALFYSFSVLPLCTFSALALPDLPSSPTVRRGPVSDCTIFFFFCYLETFTVRQHLDVGVEFMRNIVRKWL